MGGVLFAKLFSTEKKTVKMELRDSVAGRQKAGFVNSGNTMKQKISNH